LYGDLVVAPSYGERARATLSATTDGDVVLGDADSGNFIGLSNSQSLIQLMAQDVINLIAKSAIWVSTPSIHFVAGNGTNNLLFDVNGSIHSNDIYVWNDIGAGGKITGNTIGSFYRVRHDEPTGGLSIVSCDIGTSATGCSGFNSGGLLGVTPSSTSCQIIGSAIGSSTTATAVCFDPTGIREGNIIK